MSLALWIVVGLGCWAAVSLVTALALGAVFGRLSGAGCRYPAPLGRRPRRSGASRGLERERSESARAIRARGG